MIFEDKKYSNIFQLLFYSLAIEKEKKYNFPSRKWNYIL